MTYPPFPEPALPAPEKKNIIVNVATLLVLLLIVLAALVHFNIVSCGKIHPTVCDVYYTLVSGGKPAVLIVHGEKGMGNPELLYSVLRGPRFSARVNTIELDRASLPELREHQLVIVESAKTMCTEDIKMFLDYVNTGGKLIWVGDAGTEKCENDSYLLDSERNEGGKETIISPWARKEEDKQVSMDIALGLDYKANYCELVACKLPDYSGNFEFVDSKERLVYGLTEGLPFYSDFSIVEANSGGFQENIAFMNYGTNLLATPEKPWLAGERINFGKEFPVIVQSGAGTRVAYYAFPPEYYVSDEMPIDEKTGERIAYWAMLENMYYGMLYK